MQSSRHAAFMEAQALTETSSPLSGEQVEQLNALVRTLSPEQGQWISGYLAGLSAAAGGQAAAAPATESADAPTMTILYGSETGNAEGVARAAAEQAAARGLQARVVDMADYRSKELKQERLLMIVTATHGEGDPPDPATGFHEFLHSRKAPQLEGLRFAVLGLGDSSYQHFCQTAKDFDARLAELGGERLHERVDCDIDYDEPAEAWTQAALRAFAEHAEPTAAKVVSFPGRAAEAPASTYGRKNPFSAEVLDSIRLTGRGSEKETLYLELSLEGSGLNYAPGDALVVAPENRDELVEATLQAAGLDAEAAVTSGSGECSLVEALKRDYEITTLTPPFLKAYAELARNETLNRLLETGQEQALADYCWGRHVVDVLQDFPASDLDAQGFIDTLRMLRPREYSIASSQVANPDEVHLTVAAVRYHSHGRDRFGVASTHIADAVRPGDTLPVYVQPNKNFKLPADPATPIIMIGPGTGVAPFRAFLAEREESGASGDSWLFFGEQRFRTDFLYQTDWQRWLKQGTLSRMDVAFSRDGAEKRYVQHRLRERGAEVYRWLQEGAQLYVCGDAERMAPDVHQVLQDIVREQGGVSEEEAQSYLKTLQQDKRYQRDVY